MQTFSVSHPYIIPVISVPWTTMICISIYDMYRVWIVVGNRASSPAECSWCRSKVHTEATSRQSLAYIPALSPWQLAHSPENPTRPPTLLKWTDCATTPCTGKGVRSALSRFPTGYRPAGWLLPDPQIRRTRNIAPCTFELFRVALLPVHSPRRNRQFSVQWSRRPLETSSFSFLFLSPSEEAARSLIASRAS